MANCPDDLLFTKTHEWLQVNDNTATIGISEFACEQLGDLVFVELPEVGTEVTQGDEVATVESVKTAADIYAPASGTICEINQALVDSPELLNSAPYTDAWLLKIKVDNNTQPENFISAADYHAEFSTSE